MQPELDLSQCVVAKEVVEETDDGVGSLPRVESLIYEVVHLSGDALTTHPEDGALSGRLEVHWSRLEWVVRIVDLLGKIEGEVHTDRTTP